MKSNLWPLAVLAALGAAACARLADGVGVSPKSIGASYRQPKLFPHPHTAVAAADFDGDGHTDVAMVEPSHDSLLIRFNNGQSDFEVRPTLSISVGKKPVDLIAHDFNRDNRMDLAVACEGSDQVFILLNRATSPGSFDGVPVACASPSRLAVGKLSLDFEPDIAAASTATNSITVLTGIDGVFTPQAPITQAVLGMNNTLVTIDIGDLDNDKDVQEITAIAALSSGPVQGRAISLWLVPDSQPLSVASVVTTNFPAGYTPVDGLTHNIDGDPGDLYDLVVACLGLESVLFMVNEGSDTSGKWKGFGTAQIVPLAGVGSPTAVAAGALPPSDGHDDLALITNLAKTVFLRNSGVTNPRFILEPAVSAPPGSYLDLADLNGDGKIDVVLPGGFILAN